MKPSTMVVAAGLPGALVVGFFGWMGAAFAGDASPTHGAQWALFFWGVVGGACVGALPGILIGLAKRVRWVLPLLGGAIGSIPGWLEGFGAHVFGPIGDARAINIAGYGSGGFTLLGVLIGAIAWWMTAGEPK